MINPSKYGFDVDNLGALVEVRGEPATTVEQALANFLAKELMARGKAESHGYTLSDEPVVKLSSLEAIKVTTTYHEVLRDKLHPRHKTRKYSAPAKEFKITELTAGLHVHFSKRETKRVSVLEVNNTITMFISTKDGLRDEVTTKKVSNDKTVDYVCNTFVDMPMIIRTLDDEFKDVIDKTKRVTGAYEVKEYGFEYRSLPANVDLGKVAEVCRKLLRNM